MWCIIYKNNRYGVRRGDMKKICPTYRVGHKRDPCQDAHTSWLGFFRLREKHGRNKTVFLLRNTSKRNVR